MSYLIIEFSMTRVICGFDTIACVLSVAIVFMFMLDSIDSGTMS